MAIMKNEGSYIPQEFEEKIYKIWEEKGYFKAKVNKDKKPFTIVMPPPNVTSKAHIGHAMDNTLQDVLIRYKRMQGFESLWLPGTDHAALATEHKNEGLNMCSSERKGPHEYNSESVSTMGNTTK